MPEADDILGEADELPKPRKKGLADRYEESGEWKENEFEPIIPSGKYTTEKDDKVREMDIPERMQVILPT